MKFVVTFKGVRYFSGLLPSAFQYVEKTWGSRDAAWNLGVKLQPEFPFAAGL